jgi:hypothetical protein
LAASYVRRAPKKLGWLEPGISGSFVSTTDRGESLRALEKWCKFFDLFRSGASRKTECAMLGVSEMSEYQLKRKLFSGKSIMKRRN